MAQTPTDQGLKVKKLLAEIRKAGLLQRNGAPEPPKVEKTQTRLKEIRAAGGLSRDAEVGPVDVENRTVELSFSSEAEYERWFGIEILDHGQGAARLGRLNDGAPLLWNHNWDDQRGAVVAGSARIDKDKIGRVTAKISRSPAGEQLLQDMADGIVTKVSVGYKVHDMKLTEEREDQDIFTVTDWEPYEVSMVSVPADPSVGVGRGMEKPQVDDERGGGNNPEHRTPKQPTIETGTDMKEKILRDGKGNLVRAKVDENGGITEVLEIIERAGEGEKRGQDAERARIKAITDLGRAYGETDLAMKMIEDGKTAEDMQRDLLGKYAQERSKQPLDEQTKGSHIGMTDKEVRKFSLMRAIRALQPNASTQEKKAAEFEFECSRAAEEHYGKSSRGILIPADILDRAFSETTPAAAPGSNVVAQNLLSGSFIELLRNKTWLMRYATTLAGLVGNVDIPRQASATQAYWVGEGGAPASSEPGVDQIHFNPKTLGAFTDITRRLLMQSTPDAELLVRNDLLRVMALAIDYAGIYGTGTSDQPKGVKNQTGINAVAFATASKPTFDELVNMETQIALENADVNSMSYIANAGIRGYAKTTLKFPGAAVPQGGTIWEPGNQINGYNTEITNQVNAGDVFFGNWADFILAMWGGLDLMVDPYSLSTSGGTRVVVFQDVDFNIRHKESFCYGS